MNRIRTFSLALSLGLMLTLALGSTASAAVLIKDSGTHGDFGTIDYDDTHAGSRCGYSAPNSSGTAFLRWIKVFPVFAGTSSGVSSQPIKWIVTIQKSADGGASWQQVTAASQTRTASGGNSAVYDPMKLSFTGRAGKLYRAISTLKWIRNGNVTGVVKLRMEYYSVKWTVGSPSYVYHGACDGAAD